MRKRSESVETKIDDALVLLYNLIDNKYWETALSLLSELKLNDPVYEKKFLELLSSKSHSPLWVIVQQNFHLCTSAKELCLRLIEIGGEKIVKQIGSEDTRTNGSVKLTVLHLACRKTHRFEDESEEEGEDQEEDEGNWVELINTLISVGGLDYLNMKDSRDATALLYACSDEGKDFPGVVNALLEFGSRHDIEFTFSVLTRAVRNYMENSPTYDMKIIDLLLDYGGKRMVLLQNESGRTALHIACTYAFGEGSRVLGVIKKLIDVGGEDLLLTPDSQGMTSLHFACSLDIEDVNSFLRKQVIDLLLEVGRHRLLFMKTSIGLTAIELECWGEQSSESVLDRFIEIGGEQARRLLTKAKADE
jgi:hypothetical protein